MNHKAVFTIIQTVFLYNGNWPLSPDLGYSSAKHPGNEFFDTKKIDDRNKPTTFTENDAGCDSTLTVYPHTMRNEKNHEWLMWLLALSLPHRRSIFSNETERFPKIYVILFSEEENDQLRKLFDVYSFSPVLSPLLSFHARGH